MKTFSVLTVSKRTGWEKLANESMHRQTAQPELWMIVSEDKYSNSYLQSYGNTRARHIMAPAKTRLSNLNASLNAGLNAIINDEWAKSDYVIFYQDFIELQEDCFEKLLELADERTFVTTCTPNYDGSDDGRFTGCNLPRPCRPEEWEANVAIAPMRMLRDLGGFEERLDAGWSWDNVHLAKRAAMLGAKFVLDESNRPKLLDHEQTSKLEMPLNGSFCDKDIQEIRMGKRPIKLSYL